MTPLHRPTSFHQKCIESGFYRGTSKSLRHGRQAGALTLLHICGDNTRILDLQAQTGADIIAIDHAVDLRLAKQRIGNKVCLIGNMDPVGTLLFGSVADVERAAHACLEASAPGGGYILGTGCEVPQDTPLENLQAVIRVGQAHRY